MENRYEYFVIAFIWLSYFFFWNGSLFETFLSCKTLWQISFYPPTHLKRQTDILRDKIGMDVVPKTQSACDNTIFFDMFSLGNYKK